VPTKGETGMILSKFLQENKYIDFSSSLIIEKANQLFDQINIDVEKAEIAYKFQHLTLADDDSIGYCVHCYNAIYINNRWIKVDARGNTNGRNAQFSLDIPILAFHNRQNYNEFFWPGIYANPHQDIMQMLDKATCLQDVLDNIPDYVNEVPDIIDQSSK
jgi:hypothetical protein